MTFYPYYNRNGSLSPSLNNEFPVMLIPHKFVLLATCIPNLLVWYHHYLLSSITLLLIYSLLPQNVAE